MLTQSTLGKIPFKAAIPSDSSWSRPYEAAVLVRLMDGTVLSDDVSEAENVGEMLDASTIIPGGVTGEPKTSVRSSLGPVTVSVRSAKHKR